MDKRTVELAKIVNEHSIETQKDDIVLIQTEKEFMGFALQVANFAQELGAKVIIDEIDLERNRKLIDNSDDDELEAEKKRLVSLADECTKRIMIHASTNPDYLRGLDYDKILKYNKIVKKPFSVIILSKKWVAVSYPCKADADRAGMNMDEYTDFVFSSMLQDWKENHKEMTKIKEIFDNSEVHIKSKGTDIRFSLKGRGGLVASGECNLPDGEVFYGPVEDSMNGTICFTYPLNISGQVAEDIIIKVKDGVIVDYSAKRGIEILHKMFSIKEMRGIGEFGIGFNESIKRFTDKIIFDEKINGTVHFAIGFAYDFGLDRGGGKRQAPSHHDVVVDLREEGIIEVNGKVVQRNGEWLI